MDDNQELKMLNFDEKIQKFFDLFTKITKEESDIINDSLNWDSETKVAFKLAKKMFEEKDNDKAYE